MNKVMMTGFIGKDVEVRFTQAGKAVANFTFATTERWTNKDGEKQEKTDWHRMVAWGKLAEVLGQYATKGRGLMVEGKLRQSSYEDKNGVKHYTSDVEIESFEFLPSGSARYGRPSDRSQQAKEQQQEEEETQGEF